MSDAAAALRRGIPSSGDRRTTSSSRASARGRLTVSDIELLRLIADGLSDKEIAQETARNIRAVRIQFYRTYEKLGVESSKHGEKSIDAIIAARNQSVLPEEKRLSDSQQEILQGLMGGRSLTEIAQDLGLPIRSIRRRFEMACYRNSVLPTVGDLREIGAEVLRAAEIATPIASSPDTYHPPLRSQSPRPSPASINPAMLSSLQRVVSQLEMVDGMSPDAWAAAELSRSEVASIIAEACAAIDPGESFAQAKVIAALIGLVTGEASKDELLGVLHGLSGEAGLDLLARAPWVARGLAPLRLIELEILGLAADGLSDHEIARETGRKPRGIYGALFRLGGIHDKLGVRGASNHGEARGDAVSAATELGLLAGRPLSAAQVQIARRLSEGVSFRSIADELDIGISAAQFRIEMACRRYGIDKEGHSLEPEGSP